MPIKSMYKKFRISSTCSTCMLSLLLLLGTLQACATGKHKKAKGKPVEYALTVAAIRPANNDQTFVKVSFNESQRFYKLPNNADPAYIDLLKESEKNHTPVLVKRANEYSDVILRVRKKK